MAVWTLIAMTFGSILLGAIGPASAVPPPNFEVSISSTPAAHDPYLIQFNVTVVTGRPTAYDWAFGDGQYWNGSGPGYASPSHRYASPGGYNVSILVWEGNLTGTQVLPLTIVPAPLRATITVTPAANASSLTESFSATAVGGSGTYPAVLWDFGDGGKGSGFSIQYTYAKAGTYVATLNVTDSRGASTTTRTSVSVVGGPSGPTKVAFGGLEAVLVFAAAIGGAAGVALAVTRVLGRRSALRDSIVVRSETGAPSAASRHEPTVLAEISSEPPAFPIASPPSGAVAVGATDRPEAVPTPTSGGPPASTGGAPERVTPEALRLSQRIVLHLASLGRIGADDVASVGFTQRGMVEALKVRQNSLTHVVRRLVAAEILVEDVRHVRGQARRLKVYRLTSRGEALARELRQHRAASGSSAPDRRAE